MLLQLTQFSPFALLHLVPYIASSNPSPQFMSMGHAYKFFGYISYTVLNIPVYSVPTNLYFLIPVPFPPFFPLPPDNPPNDLHIYDSVSVLLVCLFWFLDSTYKWNPLAFVFLCLTYFTQHNTL